MKKITKNIIVRPFFSMSFVDYYTNVIPHMDIVSIVRLAQVTKLYYINFTSNVEMWKQILAINHKIGINTKNITTPNMINWMYLYIDMIRAIKEECKFFNDIINKVFVSMSTYIVVEKSLIYETIVPFVTNTKVEQRSLFNSGNEILNVLLKYKYIGLYYYFKSNDLIKHDNKDIVHELRGLHCSTIYYIVQRMNAGEYSAVRDYILNNELIETITFVLALPCNNFKSIISQIPEKNISYIVLKDLILTSMSIRDNVYIEVYKNYAYILNHINMCNEIFTYFSMKKNKKYNLGIDTFLSYLCDQPTFDVTRKIQAPIRWSSRNSHILTVKKLLSNPKCDRTVRGCEALRWTTSEDIRKLLTTY